MATSLWSRIKLSFKARKDLDQLLASVPKPNAHLSARTSWFFDLLEWIRHEGLIKHEDFKSGVPQAARVKYLLNVLDRNSTWKKNVAKALRSLIRDTHALDLFMETGLSSQTSFGGELVDRIQRKILPVAPRDNDLAYLFGQNFHSQTDLQWIRQVDMKTFTRIEELFRYEYSAEEGEWNSLKEDAEKALLLLAIQVQGLGLSSQIRQRIEEKDFKKISFYQLTKLIEKYVAEGDFELKAVLGSQIEKKLEACFSTLAEVQQHLDEFGVSVQIVFQIEKLENLLNRIRSLNLILMQKHLDPVTLENFIETLITENFERKSVLSLMSDSFSLLSRKITERTAETGEHYITRTKKEYLANIKKALGGGFITTFTTLIKFMVYSLQLPVFHAGFLSGLNYAISFLAIHFFHFSLATKQSAMTAPALASKMHEIEDPKAMESLIDEIINLIRSQVAAVLGNIIGVIPLTIVVCLLVELLTGQESLSKNTAMHVLEDFSVLGPTPFYAMFTGVLLWASSVFAGWTDNWFAYHRLSPAIANNRRVVFVLGEAKARAVALFLKRNIVGLAANISLGFLLGMTPGILQFLGIQLDIRHVTLSSGALAAAMTSLPLETFSSWPFWSAVLGIGSMAVFNLLVSFYLAFILAVRARRIQAPQRDLIYRAIFQRIRKNPRTLFWPKS